MKFGFSLIEIFVLLFFSVKQCLMMDYFYIEEENKNVIFIIADKKVNQKSFFGKKNYLL